MPRDYQTPEELARRFRAVGIEVVKVTEATEMFDAELELREGFSLQLADGFYVLGRFEDGTLEVVVQTTSLRRVVGEILLRFPVVS